MGARGNMISDIKFLDSIDVAAPCSAWWSEMEGDDRKRFCSDCKLHVYNLSDMSRKEAEALVRQNGDKRLCIRFYRRSDGTVLTDNCPVGLRRVRNILLRRWGAVATFFVGWFIQSSNEAMNNQRTTGMMVNSNDQSISQPMISNEELKNKLKLEMKYGQMTRKSSANSSTIKPAPEKPTIKPAHFEEIGGLDSN